jgi:hypothetical protein
MGYLRYAPNHRYAEGADHYVLAYALDEQRVWLHDPAGFPHVSLPHADLALAWRAERIVYRRGAYRSWTAPHRISQPDAGQIYDQALIWFAECYRSTRRIAAEGTYGPFVVGDDAIRRFTASIQEGTVSGETRGHLVYFALPLGAKRALDYAAFFASHDQELATAKRRQAMLFGQAHTQAVDDDWAGVARTLAELADVEQQFEAALLEQVPEPVPA